MAPIRTFDEGGSSSQYRRNNSACHGVRVFDIERPMAADAQDGSGLLQLHEHFVVADFQ